MFWESAAFVLLEKTLSLCLSQVCLGQVAAKISKVLEHHGFLRVSIQKQVEIIVRAY